MQKDLIERIKNVKTLIFDVDGVFTDASLLVGETDVQRVFNVRDGYAVAMCRKAGYKMAIITGGKQKSIETRLKGLGIEDVFLKVPTDKKLEIFDAFIQKNKLKEEEVLYVGDDIPDLLLMQARNIVKVCPADAVDEVLEIADYISPKIGGRGVVRDAIELVMKIQGTWLTVF